MIDHKVTAERQRWIALCRKAPAVPTARTYPDEPSEKLFNERLAWIADEMEDIEPRQTVEAERAIWCAMCRDVIVFSSDGDRLGVEKAIEMLYAVASDMERGSTA